MIIKLHKIYTKLLLWTSKNSRKDKLTNRQLEQALAILGAIETLEASLKENNQRSILTAEETVKAEEANQKSIIHLAVNRIPDSVWTVSYTKNANGSVTILSYSRHDKRGYEFEKSLPHVRLISDASNVIIELMIFEDFGQPTDTFEVDNPCHVLDYGCPEQYLTDYS